MLTAALILGACIIFAGSLVYFGCTVIAVGLGEIARALDKEKPC